jgi:predicted flap endonuclease-1-like 5' DNA nuclease
MRWLSFFIGVLVGWIVECFLDLFYWHRKYQSCQKEKDALLARLNESERRIKTLQAEGWKLESEPQRIPSTDVREEEAVAVSPIAPQQPDDLKLLEGIGPKISQLLNDNGILTFTQLANTSIDRLQAILQAGGPSFRLANPTTWPEQARLAADGAWDELQVLQAQLIGGRKTRR